MIYLLHGQDGFSLRESLVEIRSKIGSAEVFDANSTTLNASEITPQQLLEMCSVYPFMAVRRLIVVQGLFQSFENQRDRPRQGRARNTRSKNGDKWDNLATDVLSQIPEATLLVFIDGAIRRDNPLLRQVLRQDGFHLEERKFPLISGQALGEWIHQRVASKSAAISERARSLLMDYVGGDLWALSNEIDKLSLYCGIDEINEEAVRLLVGYTRAANVFNAVDAILGGKGSVALGLVSQLLRSGAAVSYIIVMLARQVRLVLLTQELLAQKVPRAEMARRLGLVGEFAVRRTEAQARTHTQERAIAMHRKLLETDLAIKQGAMAEEQALETLVAELCAMARPMSPGPSRSGWG